MSDITWANPAWFNAIWGVLAAVGLFFWLDRRRARLSRRLISSLLEARLVRRVSPARRGASFFFLALAGIGMVVALMRPQWGGEPIETPRIGNELMICLDVSKSMLADDVGPNRLERAKAEIRELLTRRDPRDPVGLIAFAGTAQVLCPLTPDFDSFRAILEDAEPTSVRKGGTVLAEPIYAAVEGFQESAFVSRTILLISDGEDHDDFALDAADRAAAAGIRIVTIGFGDEVEGSKIRIVDPQFGARKTLTDDQGRDVITRLNGELLRKIANRTGGDYIPARTGIVDWDSVYEHAFPLEAADTATGQVVVPEEGYPFALIFALACYLVSGWVGTSRARAVATDTRPATPQRSRAAAALAFVLAVGLAATSPLDAQSTPPPSPQGTPPEPTQPAPAVEPEPSAPEFEPPSDPIAAYDAGREFLEGGALDRAEQCFQVARERAGSHRDLQYYATYNLGWSLARRAETLTEASAEPDVETLETAIREYEAAGSWFRRAISLREEENAPRQNLEVVERRALMLRDLLAQKDGESVEEKLDRAIEAQREILGALGRATSAFAQVDDSSSEAVRNERRRLDQRLAAEQRIVTNEVAAIVRHAGRELDVLKSRSAEELQPQDQLRMFQLDQLLPLLNTAMQRMSQTRRQARLSEYEPGYRRAAIALNELEKARDQLRNIAERLQAIRPDQEQVTRSVAQLARASLSPDEKAPAWLTARYLDDTQSGVRERLESLQQFTQLVLASMEMEASQADAQDPSAGPGTPPAPIDPRAEEERAILKEQLESALPHLDLAIEKTRAANESLALDHHTLADWQAAHGAATEATVEITRALELFLDHRALINLMYTTEQQIAAPLSQSEWKDAEGNEIPAELVVAGLRELQKENLGRSPRLAELLEREREKAAEQAAQQPPSTTPPTGQPAPDPTEQFEQALAILETANGFMDETVRALDPFDRAAAAPAAESARAELEKLRRLFYTLIDHLRETVQRQARLVADVEEAQSLPTPEEQAQKAGPLVPTEQELAAIAEQIAQALAEAPPPSGAQDPAQAARAQEAIARATDLVTQGVGSAQKATDLLQEDPLDLEAAHAEARRALERWAEALALLQPPPQDQPQDGSQQQQEQQQQQDESDESQEEQPAEAQQAEPQPRENEDDETKRELPGSIPSILQQIRDREEERRQAKKDRRPREPLPGEKDW